jgi:hypothetical protein
MARLKIVRNDGTELIGEISPAIEYAFENFYKTGFHKAFRELEQQSMVYYLAWEITKRAGEAPKPFGESFIDTLKSVTVEDSDPLA